MYIYIYVCINTCQYIVYSMYVRDTYIFYSKSSLQVWLLLLWKYQSVMLLFWHVPVIGVFSAQDPHVLQSLVQSFHKQPWTCLLTLLEAGHTEQHVSGPWVITHAVTVRNHRTVAAEHLLCGGNLHGGTSNILYIISPLWTDWSNHLNQSLLPLSAEVTLE